VNVGQFQGGRLKERGKDLVGGDVCLDCQGKLLEGHGLIVEKKKMRRNVIEKNKECFYIGRKREDARPKGEGIHRRRGNASAKT